ncbi:MAG TPA: hypothetical protein VD886_02660 [Herpetosiphonaceae bacterium]|nr:hypothetical protein [Herpetosiphonaceae bacterium]
MDFQSGSRVELRNGQRGTVREKTVVDDTLTLTVQIDEFPDREQWIKVPAELVTLAKSGPAALLEKAVGGSGGKDTTAG